MKRSSLFSSKRSYVPNGLKAEYAFTLVEVLVAMLILTLVVFAMTPLLLGSIERIYYAGDKSEAMYEGQSVIEVDIATRSVDENDGFEMVFDFGETEVVIPGGLIDVEITRGNATAWLRGFVPFIPAIILNPAQINEGYSNSQLVTVTGRDIEDYNDLNFIFSDGELYLYTQQGVYLTKYVLTDNLDNEEAADFYLSSGLKNSGSPYLAAVKWLIEGGIEVTAYERLQINLPGAVAVGGGQSITISPNATDTWSSRSHTVSGSGTFKDVIWTGFEFVAVSTSKKIVVWRDRAEPVSVKETSQNLNSVAYSGGKYVAVGDNGLILVSDDRVQWNPVSPAVSVNNLNDVVWTGNKFLIMGSNGTILSSDDGVVWQVDVTSGAGGVNFYGAAYGNNRWLAVGQGLTEAVIFELNEGIWSQLVIPYTDELTVTTTRFNDIVHDGEKFIVVGESGTVLTLIDGAETWGETLLGSSTPRLALYALDWGSIGNSKHYIIVGAAGSIYSSSDGVVWTAQTAPASQDIMNVALRWMN